MFEPSSASAAPPRPAVQKPKLSRREAKFQALAKKLEGAVKPPQPKVAPVQPVGEVKAGGTSGSPRLPPPPAGRPPPPPGASASLPPPRGGRGGNAGGKGPGEKGTGRGTAQPGAPGTWDRHLE
eukprot:9790606-Alexandrium_andersonii.AAC.1